MKNNLQTLKSSYWERFFYAHADAELYDQTIELVVPYYNLVIQLMIDLLKYHFNKPADEVKGVLLDIGAGTGAESIRVMKEFPLIKTVAVDLCEPMKAEFARKFKANFKDSKSAKNRYKYITSDILDSNLTSEVLLNQFEESRVNGSFNLIITAYTFHHFYEKEKKLAYKKMHELLEPGGLFINIDLFNYKSKLLSEYSHQYEINWMKKEFANPRIDFKDAHYIPKKTRLRLSSQWVEHYEKHNILHPLENQMEMLHNIGFSEVGNPFNYIQNGLLWAKK